MPRLLFASLPVLVLSNSPPVLLAQPATRTKESTAIVAFRFDAQHVVATTILTNRDADRVARPFARGNKTWRWCGTAERGETLPDELAGFISQDN
jgi:hypothetical protein